MTFVCFICKHMASSNLVSFIIAPFLAFTCDYSVYAIIIIIIITTTIFIVLSSTSLAICESSLWFLWAKVGQRQVAANS